PVAAALVADHVPPAAGAGRLARSVAAVRDRTGTGDEHDRWIVARSSDERDQGVVDDKRARLVADAPHHRAYHMGFVLAIDAGDAEADGRRNDRAIADRAFHDVVQDLLDRQLAGGVQIRAGTARFRQDRAAIVREEAHRFRASRVDAEDVHAQSILC